MRRGMQQAITQLRGVARGHRRGARPRGDDRRDSAACASIVTVGLMMARAALRREESRGGHFRSDFPNHDDIKWRKHVADVR